MITLTMIQLYGSKAYVAQEEALIKWFQIIGRVRQCSVISPFLCVCVKYEMPCSVQEVWPSGQIGEAGSPKTPFHPLFALPTAKE